MPNKNSISSKAPYGTWCYYHPEKQQYSLGSRIFAPKDIFVLVFTLLWTAGFLAFMYQTVFLVLISDASFEWFTILFWFSHGIPSFFLCRYSFRVIFGKIIFTLDAKQLHFFKGAFGKGDTQELLLSDIQRVLITKKEEKSDGKTIMVESITIYAGETTLECGDMLSHKQLYFLQRTLQNLLKNAQQGILFLEKDFSQHLID